MVERETTDQQPLKEDAAAAKGTGVQVVGADDLSKTPITRKGPIWQGLVHAEARRLIELEQVGFREVFGIEAPLSFKVEVAPEKAVEIQRDGAIITIAGIATMGNTTIEFTQWPTTGVVRHEMAHHYHGAVNKSVKDFIESSSSIKDSTELFIFKALGSVILESIAFAYEGLHQEGLTFSPTRRFGYEDKQQLLGGIESLLNEEQVPVVDQLFDRSELDQSIDHEALIRIVNTRLRLAYKVGMSAGMLALCDLEKPPLVTHKVIKKDSGGEQELGVQCKLGYERLELKQREARMRELFYMDAKELFDTCCRIFDAHQSHVQRSMKTAWRQVAEDLRSGVM